MNIITLTSDFGLMDPFAGMMKGVIYSINNEVKIVDISHGVDSQDIFWASFITNASYRYFPCLTIHVVVVDPGVGSARKAILVKASGHYFIGPDNGVLSSVITGDSNSVIYEITDDRYFLRSAGNTFHGRDIFAPVAAWLSKGCDPANFGHVTTDYVSIDIPEPLLQNGMLTGEIIYIDRFGNLFTNLDYKDIDKQIKAGSASTPFIRLNQNELLLKKHYAEAGIAETAAVINSFGLIEIYTFMGNAAIKTGAKKGDTVSLCFK